MTKDIGEVRAGKEDEFNELVGEIKENSTCIG